jgi:hypothetical protein
MRVDGLAGGIMNHLVQRRPLVSLCQNSLLTDPLLKVVHKKTAVDGLRGILSQLTTAFSSSYEVIRANGFSFKVCVEVFVGGGFEASVIGFLGLFQAGGRTRILSFGDQAGEGYCDS